MTSGWRYRVTGLVGTVCVTVLAVSVSYHPLVQSLAELVPLLGDLPIDSATEMELLFEITTTMTIIVVAFAPLYRPQPRRILDTWMLALQRTGIALLALATIGYFDYRMTRPLPNV